MNSSTLVSVIIPVYNVEKYVRDCLESVINQTYRNLEIIIVNDGSTDRSPQICHEFKDPRIIFIDKENGGLSDARNKGVEASSGEYITFVDSDDVIHPQLIEELLQNLLKYEGDISGCGFVRYDDKKPIEWENSNNVIKKWTSNEAMNELVGGFSNDLTVAWCKLYPREILMKFPFPYGKIHEDEFVSYKIISSIKVYIYSSKKLYGYRQRSNSIMSMYNLSAEKDRIEAKRLIFEYYLKNIKNQRSLARSFFLLMRNIELSYYKICNVNKNEDYLKELIVQYEDLYSNNLNLMKMLNYYERWMLKLFYKSKRIFRYVEAIKRGSMK